MKIVIDFFVIHEGTLYLKVLETNNNKTKYIYCFLMFFRNNSAFL